MKDFSQCRAFLVHLQEEHERLHADVRVIERALRAQSDRHATLRMRDSLVELRAEMVRHFEEEERGGCLEEAVSHCPRLSSQAVALEREHPLLLQGLAQLIERAGASEARVDSRLAEDFHQFARNLHAHESAEHQILREAFGCGDQDDV